MLHLFALLLMFISLASGIVILTSAFGIQIKGSLGPFWLLYCAGFIGGIILIGRIADTDTQNRYINWSSVLQLLFGIIAAVLIFLDKLMILETNDPMVLWILFVIGVTTGIWGIARSK